MDAATMQQLLGGGMHGVKGLAGSSKSKTTPKKTPLPSSLSGLGISGLSTASAMPTTAASLATMDMLRQQEQLLLLTGQLKPEQLNSQELQLLAQQVSRRNFF